MSITLFSLKLQNTSWEDLRAALDVARKKEENLRITTVNPEYLLEAKSNRRFLESLRGSDLRLIDGVGICLLAMFQGVRLQRLTGADVLPLMLTWAEKEGLPVAIYNSEQGLSSQSDIEMMLHAKYPNLHFDYNLQPTTYGLILCTYGAPTQEFLLDTLETPAIKMGIGGALDFLTGTQVRAPYLLRLLGLEWLWRLLRQPRRINRIWRAVVVFPLQGIMEISKEKYGRKI